LRACAREEIDIDVPFEELPKPDQDFVINGEKRLGEYTEDDYEHDRWYGVRGFFCWLESQVYKMHMRVLLSRYRAYTTCPSCHGGRFQPEALNYKISETGKRKPESKARTSEARDEEVSGIRYPQSEINLTPPDFAALSISNARDLLAKIEIPANDPTAKMLRDEM